VLEDARQRGQIACVVGGIEQIVIERTSGIVGWRHRVMQPPRDVEIQWPRIRVVVVDCALESVAAAPAQREREQDARLVSGAAAVDELVRRLACGAEVLGEQLCRLEQRVSARMGARRAAERGVE
jgi:hypothetical protein